MKSKNISGLLEKNENLNNVGKMQIKKLQNGDVGSVFLELIFSHKHEGQKKIFLYATKIQYQNQTCIMGSVAEKRQKKNLYKKPLSEVEKITKREREILKHLSEGRTSQQIADMLFVSVYTVKEHRKNLLAKTNCKNTADLIFYASKYIFNDL